MNTCPACGSEYLSSYGEDSACLSCELFICNSSPYDESMYDADYALNYVKRERTVAGAQLNLIRLGLAAQFLPPGGRVLDIGCGAGTFLRYASPYYECLGYDLNTEYCHPLASVTSVWDEALEFIEEGTLVTMFDSLEHFTDPFTVLESLVGHKARVLITTPNVTKAPGRSPPKWKHYKPGEHLWLFSPSSLESFARDRGWSVLHCGEEENSVREDIFTVVLE